MDQESWKAGADATKRIFKDKLEDLASELDNAARRHLRSEFGQDRGKGLLDAAFAVQALVKELCN